MASPSLRCRVGGSNGHRPPNLEGVVQWILRVATWWVGVARSLRAEGGKARLGGGIGGLSTMAMVTLPLHGLGMEQTGGERAG